MSTLTIGQAIFTAFKPIVKMVAVTTGGAILTHKGILTQAATKSNAGIIVNFLMPMLVFSTVTVSFNPENSRSITGVLITGIVYSLMGLFFGFLVRCFTPVPRTWRGGVLMNGSLANWGDLLVATILTIAKSEPFNGTVDSTRGVAYASIFIIVQTLTTFSFGGIQLIQSDFREVDPSEDPERGSRIRSTISAIGTKFGIRLRLTDPPIESIISVSRISKESVELSFTIESPKISKNKARMIFVWSKIAPFLTPPTLAMFIAIIVANVPPLKALFVATEQFNMTKAPDGKPPLDFVMEICSFGGAAMPVMGMILLGAELSKLSFNGLPKGFWKSAVSMAVLKLVVGPVLGVIWTKHVMNRSGLINPDDKMLQFILIFTAGVPTATLQVYITNIYAPDGSVEMSALSAFLLAQYILMLVSVTVLISYIMVVII